MPDDRTIHLDWPHRVRFTRGVLDPANPLLTELMTAGPPQPAAKALIVVDRGLADAWPDLEDKINHAFDAPAMPRLMGVRVVPGGEDAKNDLGYLEGLLGDLHRTGLCRQSFVLAFGGGAVLDMAGFAASIVHRGVRLIRLPTTTLAQADAGIGVKNGVNMFGLKNMLGTFAVPWAVINDADFLGTLTDRDWRCGLAEAVKVALLKDPAFFERLCDRAPALARRDTAAGQRVWQRCAQLHIDHIADGGDPFESRSARPLDLGHWAGHRLEQLSGFSLRHGEAVALGLAIDVRYSHLTGLLPGPAADRILGCLQSLGFDLTHPLLKKPDALLDGLEQFRQHLGGELTLTLLRAIGDPVDVHAVTPTLMHQAIAPPAAAPTP